MAYVAPTTRTTGTLITAVIWNSDCVANPAALYAGAMALTSQAANELIYATSASQLGRIGVGLTGQVLIGTTGGAPSWTSNVSIGGTLGVAGNLAVATDKFVVTAATGAIASKANNISYDVTSGTVSVRQTTTDAQSVSSLSLQAGTTDGGLFAYGQSYSPITWRTVSTLGLFNVSAGGITIVADHASGDVRIWSRSALAVVFGASQSATFAGAISSSTSVALTGATNNLGTITSGIWNAGAVTSSGTITGVAGAFTGNVSIVKANPRLTLTASAATNAFVDLDGPSTYGSAVQHYSSGALKWQVGMGIGASGNGYGWANITNSIMAMTLSEAGLLTLSGNAATYGLAFDGSNGGGIAATHASGALRFYPAGTIRGTMHASGGFSWGDTTDPGATNFRVAGTTKLVSDTHVGTGLFVGNTTDAISSGVIGALSGFKSMAGASTGDTLYFPNIAASTGTTMIRDASGYIRPLSSSERYKKNIQRGKAFPVVAQRRYIDLAPIVFDYEHGAAGVLGFSAEDIAAAQLPELLNFDTAGRPESIREHAFLAMHHSVLKALTARIETLERKQ